MPRPSIAAVIPAYNRAGLIGRAVESALGQTRPADEVIVVDDGSTDGTAEVCRGFEPRVRFVRQANGGASSARNRGVDEARSDWIAFLDSDDYWTGDHLEKMTEAIEATGEKADLYFCDMRMPPGSAADTLWQMIGFRVAGPAALREDGAEWMLAPRQPTMLQASAIRKRRWREIGGLKIRHRLLHDTDVFCELGLGGPVCAVNHLGCIQTADAELGGRLTGIVPTESKAFWIESIDLWSRLLRDPRLQAGRDRAEVRRKLANSCWRAFRISWKARELTGALRFAVRAAWISPAFVSRALWRGTSRS